MTITLARGSATLDTTRFPVVTLSERGVLRDAERVEVIEALLDLLIRDERHALVFDLFRGSALSEPQRVYVAEQLLTHKRQIRDKWAGIAVVVREQPAKSPTASFWLRVSPVPAQAFTALDEAATWARAQSAGPREGGARSADRGLVTVTSQMTRAAERTVASDHGVARVFGRVDRSLAPPPKSQAPESCETMMVDDVIDLVDGDVEITG